MEVGGLVLEAFTIFLGNPDVMATLISWSIFLTMGLIVIQLFNRGRE